MVDVTTRPVRRTDLEQLKKIGMPQRVVDSIEQVINDVFGLLPDAINGAQQQITVIQRTNRTVVESSDAAVDVANRALTVAGSASQAVNSLVDTLDEYIPIFGVGSPLNVVESNLSRLYIDSNALLLYVNIIGENQTAGWVATSSAPIFGYGLRYGVAYGN